MAGNRCFHSIEAKFCTFDHEAPRSNFPRVFRRFLLFSGPLFFFLSAKNGVGSKDVFLVSSVLLLSFFSSFFFLLRLFRGGRKGVKVTELTLMGGVGCSGLVPRAYSNTLPPPYGTTSVPAQPHTPTHPIRVSSVTFTPFRPPQKRRRRKKKEEKKEGRRRRKKK